MSDDGSGKIRTDKVATALRRIESGTYNHSHNQQAIMCICTDRLKMVLERGHIKNKSQKVS